MPLYDISLPLSNALTTWEGDPPISLTFARSISNGDACNLTNIQMGAHSGTHIDAPFHFIHDGVKADAIPLDILIGPCLVVELDTDRPIEKNDLERLPLQGHKRVLLKTRNSKLWNDPAHPFDKNFVALGETGAQYLINSGIQLIGIDYLSIESFHSKKNAVHKALLQHNIVILEGINLSQINKGTYELLCLPLNLKGCEGAPARAILRTIT